MLFQQSVAGGYSVIAQATLHGHGEERPIEAWLFALIRDAGATVLLMVAAASIECCWRQPGRGDPSHGGSGFWPSPTDVPRLLLAGLCGIWGGQLLGVIAIQGVGAVVFSAAQPAMPVVTLLVSVLIGMEPLVLTAPGKARYHRCCGDKYGEASSDDTESSDMEKAVDLRPCVSGWLKLAGVTLTVAGGIVIVLLDAESHHSAARPTTTLEPLVASAAEDGGGRLHVGRRMSRQALGYVALAAQILLGGIYGVVQKPLLYRYSSVVVCAWGYLVGTIEILLTCFVSIAVVRVFPGTAAVLPDVASAVFWQVPASAMWPLLYAIVVMSAIGYSIQAWVNQRASPLFVTTFCPVNTVAAAAFAFVFLGESAKPPVYCGAGLIAAGLYCVLAAKVRDAALVTEGEASSSESALL